MVLLQTSALLLLACAALALCFWVVVWVRLLPYVRSRPTILAGLENGDAQATVRATSLSVIVPAHNEEQMIAACCHSLCAQDFPGRLEFIFVLDRCTDRTAEVLRKSAEHESRVIIIENSSCPEHWAGKCNAARIGSERATGEFILFTDADTQFDPALCRAAVSLAQQRGLALLSLLSTLTFEKWFERIAQPVATMQLMRIYPPMRQRSLQPTRPFANGQFMLFPRAWYEKIGGHAAVQDDLLEDLAFASRVQETGGHVASFFADGMLRCEMYESLSEFQIGWKRIFIEACRRKPKRLRKHARRLQVIGVLLPLLQVLALVMTGALFIHGYIVLASALLGTVALGWIAQLWALARAYALGGAPRWAALCYPVGAWLVAKAMLHGAGDLVQRRAVKWGGREYVLEPR